MAGPLLAVLAHPDDESMGTAGLLARHAAAGVAVHLLCVTRGGAGWQGKPAGATIEDLPRIRTGELEAAAAVLGLSGVQLWDYPDGAVRECDQAVLTREIAQAIDALRPAVVIGWGPDGAYGHPDHIAVGACTDAAVASAAEEARPALYHLALDEELARAYRQIMVMAGEGDGLPVVAVPGAAPIVHLTPQEIQIKLQAIDCHASQLEDWRVAIVDLPDLLQATYGREPYVPIVGGRRELGPAGLLAEFS